MTKTSTERMRELRARKKQAKKAAENALAAATYVKPLSDFFSETNRSGFGDHFLMLGDNWWDFSNDGPLLPLADDALEEGQKRLASNSLGKAEMVIDLLGDVVSTLTQDLNDYKRAEIQSRIREIEESDLSEATARKSAVAQIIKLQKMLTELDTQVRWTFPKWNVGAD
ncbi:hypothetical protein [Rhizobium sp. 18065]|uniref:hypothetical protein n=1 Tax=Rhizobium sp. 18065 TaxID=2681411 RepID=UPI001357EB93|nr:hypothetical protein [Rhizobium sp. 18065]